MKPILEWITFCTVAVIIGVLLGATMARAECGDDQQEEVEININFKF